MLLHLCSDVLCQLPKNIPSDSPYNLCCDAPLTTAGKCLVSGHVCVELGSGTGAVGLVAAGLGASHVILTELAHLVPYLRDNVKVGSLRKVTYVYWEAAQTVGLWLVIGR